MGAKAQEDRAAGLLLWLRQREDEVAALLGDLVAVPTENPPGRNYHEFADLFEKRVAKLGLLCERLEPSPEGGATDNTLACLSVGYGQGDRVFYFHGHYDVVPAQSEE